MRTSPQGAGDGWVSKRVAMPFSEMWRTRGSLLKAIAAASGIRTEKPLRAVLQTRLMLPPCAVAKLLAIVAMFAVGVSSLKTTMYSFGIAWSTGMNFVVGSGGGVGRGREVRDGAN